MCKQELPVLGHGHQRGPSTLQDSCGGQGTMAAIMAGEWVTVPSLQGYSSCQWASSAAAAHQLSLSSVGFGIEDYDAGQATIMTNSSARGSS